MDNGPEYVRFYLSTETLNTGPGDTPELSYLLHLLCRREPHDEHSRQYLWSSELAT